jgi:hypothetical protein
MERYTLCGGLWLRFRSLFKKPWPKSAVPSCCHDMIIEGSKLHSRLHHFNASSQIFQRADGLF